MQCRCVGAGHEASIVKFIQERERIMEAQGFGGSAHPCSWRSDRWRKQAWKALATGIAIFAAGCDASPRARREHHKNLLDEMRRAAVLAFDRGLKDCRSSYPPDQERNDCLKSAQARFHAANEYVDKQTVHMLDRDARLSEAELRAIWEWLRELSPDTLEWEKFRKRFKSAQRVVPVGSAFALGLGTRRRVDNFQRASWAGGSRQSKFLRRRAGGTGRRHGSGRALH